MFFADTLSFLHTSHRRTRAVNSLHNMNAAPWRDE